MLYLRPREMLKIALNFSTIDLDGLLFWSSRDNAKFLGLGIEGGHIKLASHLLDNADSTLDIPTGGFVADGGWHNVQLDIDKKLIQLSVDGRQIFTENKKIIGDLKKIDDDREFLADMENLFYLGKNIMSTCHFIVAIPSFSIQNHLLFIEFT